MNVVVWAGHCSRCGRGVGVEDYMDLYLTVGDDGTVRGELICKNARMCQEREAAREA